MIISNEEENVIIKIVKSLEEFGLLKKGVIKTINHEATEKGGFPTKLLGSSAASLLGTLLTGKGIVGTCEGTIKVDTIRAVWMPSHFLTNFEIQKYYQIEP